VVVGPAEGVNEKVAAGGWNGAGVGLVEEEGGSGLTMVLVGTLISICQN
jgi:hypothetical protein